MVCACFPFLCEPPHSQLLRPTDREGDTSRGEEARKPVLAGVMTCRDCCGGASFGRQRLAYPSDRLAEHSYRKSWPNRRRWSSFPSFIMAAPAKRRGPSVVQYVGSRA